jgi:hypothetical protein
MLQTTESRRKGGNALGRAFTTVFVGFRPIEKFSSFAVTFGFFQRIIGVSSFCPTVYD